MFMYFQFALQHETKTIYLCINFVCVILEKWVIIEKLYKKGIGVWGASNMQPLSWRGQNWNRFNCCITLQIQFSFFWCSGVRSASADTLRTLFPEPQKNINVQLNLYCYKKIWIPFVDPPPPQISGYTLFAPPQLSGYILFAPPPPPPTHTHTNTPNTFFSYRLFFI